MECQRENAARKLDHGTLQEMRIRAVSAVRKAKLVRDFVAAQEGRLRLFYLPPYAPQLNPDELVWGHVKKQVSRQIPQSQDDLKFLVLSALRRLQKPPHIVAGFFRHPQCRYAIS